jgi:ubiquinone/menaquinone biosynthesis C-methylase UbiE
MTASAPSRQSSAPPHSAGRRSLSMSIKKRVRAVINRAGYDLTKITHNKKDPLCEGFESYLASAEKAGVDVNDWIESELHWEPALATLKEVVFPFLDTKACVCEIGSGTGRHARHIIPRIDQGTLHLIDHSTWIQGFLRQYFISQSNVIIHSSNGTTIDMPNSSVDFVFSNGTVIEMKLGTIFLLSKECARICKPNGKVAFDYIDISTDGGWEYLITQSAIHSRTFTYHCGHTIDRLFADAGFVLTKRYQEGKSTYVVFTKKT